MLLRDTPQAFADAVVNLLNDPALGARLGQQGREWVVQNHAWARSAERLHQVYSHLIGHEDPTLRLSERESAAWIARLHQALEQSNKEKNG
jgi:hypothetical protein